MKWSKIYSTEELVYFNEMWAQEDTKAGSTFKLIVKNELGRMSFIGISDEDIKANVYLDLVEIIKKKNYKLIKVKNKEKTK